MAITATLVRELREKTGAAMMDCKKALEATGGDLEAAVDHLRKSGLKTAEKKAQRDTGDGRVFSIVSEDGSRGSIVAVQCETDFVAKTPDFTAFLTQLCEHVLGNDAVPVDGLLAQPWSAGGTVEDGLKQLIGKLGENIRVADARQLGGDGHRVGTYIHHNDKVGVLVSVSGAVDEETLKDLCLHIAFHKPPYLSRDEVSEEDIERERKVLMESEEVQKKPEEIRAKIVEGKMKSFFVDKCLLEQPWVKDDKQSVQKALGDGVKVEAFCCLEVGA